MPFNFSERRSKENSTNGFSRAGGHPFVGWAETVHRLGHPTALCSSDSSPQPLMEYAKDGTTRFF